MAAGQQHSKESQIVEKENFDNYDHNKDGILDYAELREWAMPTQAESAVDETDHLLEETDDNGDGVLSFEEIIDHHDIWVGSAVTDYGRHLHDPSEL